MQYANALSWDRSVWNDPERCHYAVIVRWQIELSCLVHLVQLADYVLDRRYVNFAERGGWFGLSGLAFLLFLGIFRFSSLFGFSFLFSFLGCFLFFLLSFKPGLLFALLSLFGPLADFLDSHRLLTRRSFQHPWRV